MWQECRNNCALHLVNMSSLKTDVSVELYTNIKRNQFPKPKIVSFNVFLCSKSNAQKRYSIHCHEFSQPYQLIINSRTHCFQWPMSINVHFQKLQELWFFLFSSQTLKIPRTRENPQFIRSLFKWFEPPPLIIYKQSTKKWSDLIEMWFSILNKCSMKNQCSDEDTYRKVHIRSNRWK